MGFFVLVGLGFFRWGVFLCFVCFFVVGFRVLLFCGVCIFDF